MVVVTAAAVTGVAATGAAEERMQVAVAQATEAVEVQVAVALAAVVRCSRSAGPCAGALRLRKHRARRAIPHVPRFCFRVLFHLRDFCVPNMAVVTSTPALARSPPQWAASPVHVLAPIPWL